MMMEVPSTETVMKKPTSSDGETLTKPVPRPFSIEALMSDCGPRKNDHNNSHIAATWNLAVPQHFQVNSNHCRDTDSDGSLDMDLAQDLSRRSQKDGTLKYVIDIIRCVSITLTTIT